MQGLQESAHPSGFVRYVLRGPDGRVKKEWAVPNLVVTAGKAAMAARLGSDTPAGQFMPYIGVGTGTTSPLIADTTLETETARVAGTVSNASNVVTNTATFPAGTGTGTLTEAALFSASSAGTMFSRQTFSPVGKEAGDALDVTWQITIS